MAVELGVIADDLSGAGDSGLQFAKRGLQTVVLFEVPDEPPTSDVLVIDTDSRQVSAALAAERVTRSVRAFRSLGVGTLYKKVDSTVRGNVGREIDALLDEVPGSGALFCPAFPAAGRTIVDGQVLVGGVLLADTEFASDPLWPARSSLVASVVATQSRRRVGNVRLRAVRAGAAAIASELGSLRAAGVEIVVADATSSTDLFELAQVIAASRGAWIGVGSAGLAEELPGALGLRPGPESNVQRTSSEPGRPNGTLNRKRMTLAVVGSINPTARAQLRTLSSQTGRTPVGLRVSPILSGEAEAEDEIVRLAAELHGLGHDADLSLTIDATASEVQAAAAARNVDMGAAAIRLATALGRVAALTIGNGRHCAGLVMTGGDTAKGVCLALGSYGVAVEREVLPGIPQGRLLGGTAAGLPVVTKAGGFGGPEALAEAVRFLRRI